MIRDYTAGDPMRPGVRWTNLSLRDLRAKLILDGFRVSLAAVSALLRRHHFGRRQAQKKLSAKRHPQREQQFRKIAQRRREYEDAGNPIVSVDTKKKEFIGNLFRAGRLYTQETIATLDHDFPTSAEGVIYPHGFYDPVRNVGHINLGTSHDTSLFACDSIGHWWENYGRKAYPNATSILILCDGVAAIRRADTCSNTIWSNWRPRFKWRFGWRTIRRTARSTIRLSIVFFLM